MPRARKIDLVPVMGAHKEISTETRKDLAWIQERSEGKEIHKRLMDTVRDFSSYVDLDGDSSNSGRHAYISLNKMINRAFLLEETAIMAKSHKIDHLDFYDTDLLAALTATKTHVEKAYIEGRRKLLPKKEIYKRRTAIIYKSAYDYYANVSLRGGNDIPKVVIERYGKYVLKAF